MPEKPMRASSRLLLVAALFALAIAAVLWRAGETVRPAGPAAHLGGPFALTGPAGRTVTDKDFRGRFMLVYFGYSFCPDVCPTTLAMMAAALDRLGPKRDRVVPVFITIDPARDTQAVLKAYMASFGPAFVGLTGNDRAIRAVAKAYGVYYKKHPLPGGNYGMDHTGAIYLMGPDGKFVTYYQEGIGADALAADLKKRV